MRIDEKKAGFVAWLLVVLSLLIFLLRPAPSRAEDQPAILAELLAMTQQLMHLPGKPQFVMMTTEQMQDDGCINPANCPTLDSVHPPLTDKIIVNADADLTDLNVQGQIVHVIAMYLTEKAGGYSPDMPCNRVMQIEAHAQVVQAAFMDLRIQEYIKTGQRVPPFEKHLVWTFCTPPAVRGEF